MQISDFQKNIVKSLGLTYLYFCHYAVDYLISICASTWEVFALTHQLPFIKITRFNKSAEG